MNFCQIQNHKGKSIGRKTEKCLLSSGIFRVFTVIVDNASCNDISLSYLKVSMKDWNVHPLKGEYLHVKCCTHILNLIVSYGLKDINDSIIGLEMLSDLYILLLVIWMGLELS